MRRFFNSTKKELAPVAKLVGYEIEGHLKWSSCVTGADDCIYGIPCNARRVAKFDPSDKSLVEIGPDLGRAMWKWQGGVLANDGCIYCLRSGNPDNSVLKIDTVNGNITVHQSVLPESGAMMWAAGALGPDGCIYYMPAYALRVLKFDPRDLSFESVGEQVRGHGWKHFGTVVGNDGCIYGIPNEATAIVRYNPTNQHTSYVAREAKDGFGCKGNGALGRDGHIYAVNVDGQVLRVDLKNDTYNIFGAKITSENPQQMSKQWGDAILGNDGCIYWPPSKAKYTLKFDPGNNSVTQVGGEFKNSIYKWSCGAATSDNIIYCLPINASHVLEIDPFSEFVSSLQNNLVTRPGDVGCLFNRDVFGETGYESAVRKYGLDTVTKVVHRNITNNSSCAGVGLPLFILAAACDKSATPLIYNLFRSDPSLMNGLS